MKYYAGIGSRETPPNVETYMMAAAWYLDNEGYILRSGGAAGADSAFESGMISDNKEIYLPYKKFNKNESSLYLEAFDQEIVDAAYQLARKYRPGLDEAGKPTHKFMTRNMMQILGKNLNTPVEFVLCWTKNGKDIGGTGAAIRCALDHNIPVYNLYNSRDKEEFKSVLLGMEMMKKLLPLGDDDVALQT